MLSNVIWCTRSSSFELQTAGMLSEARLCPNLVFTTERSAEMMPSGQIYIETWIKS